MENLAMRHGMRVAALATGAAAAATFACALMCPANALADGGVAYSVDDQGNKTYYSSIDDAMSAGYSLEDNTIVMNADWNVSKTLYITDSKKLVIDMNGHSIHSTDSDYVFRLYEHSTLELKSSRYYGFTYQGYSKNGMNNWSYKSKYLFTGGLVTDDNGGRGLRMDSYSTLKLDNVAVAGNKYSGIDANTHCTVDMSNKATVTANISASSGAGINFMDYGTLKMDNATIDGNYATNSYGGGVYATSNTYIYLENNSKIINNDAMAGGGICFSETFDYVVSEDGTGSVSGNTAYSTSSKDGNESGGGGIQLKQKAFGENEGKIKGVKIANNYSAYNGGGIDLEQEWTRIEDCTITGNTAAKYGGGVYDGNDDNHISDCTIKNNVCNEGGKGNCEGGGVFVGYYEDIALHGVCIITNNTRGRNGSADDLFLADDGGATHAYIVGGIKKGTKVGVRTGITGTQKIGKDLETNCYGAFFIDLPGYYVGYQYDDHGNMQQNTGSLVFSTNINSTYTGRYEQGKTITANGTSYDSGKVFWYWDADNTTGLYPVSDFINSKNMYNPFLSYTMPQNDVHLKAVYADRTKKLTLGIAAPLAGDSLDSSIEFRRMDYEGTNGALYNMKGYATWYEVKADGSKVLATGNAKPGTRYVASVTIAQDQKYGLFFDSGISAGDISVVSSSTVDASSVSLDAATGALSMEIGTFKTKGTAPAEESTGKVTVNEVNGGLQALLNESGKSTQGATEVSMDTVDFYYSEGSNSVTITAPKVNGMNFCNWEGVKQDWLSDDVEGTVTIPAEALVDGLELTAVYTPVVTSIKVNLSVPTAGNKLATKVTSFTAKTSDGKAFDLMSAFDKKSLKASWTPDDSKAAYSTAYAVVVELADDDGYEGLGDVLAENATVKLANGAKATSAGFAVVDGKLCLCLVAPETGKVASVTGLKAAKAGKGAVKVSWKKADRSGVQVRYSTAKSMKSAKTVTVKGKAKTAKKIKKLKRGKRYYFQVRAYKTVDGKKCYGSWSAKKSVKVK